MLSALYNFIARSIVVYQSGVKHVVGDNGWSWAVSIVLLVMTVRLILVPLFVKQIKTQRTMQLMQPKIKELREKYKNDKQKMNEEMIKLQREHGNPLLGCLPMFLQIPIFLSLYRVMNGFEPKGGTITPQNHPGAVLLHSAYYYPNHRNGLSVEQASKIADAKIFGASIASSLRSSERVFSLLDGSKTGTYVVCIVLIIVMMVTTFLTQKQIIGRNGPVQDPNQAMTQKLLLYVSPVALGFFGIRVAVGGLLYWFTTNLWSLAQQFFVIRRMPPVIAPGAAGAPAVALTKSPGGGGLRGTKKQLPATTTAEPARLVQQRAVPDPAGSGAAGPGGANRPPRGGGGARKKKGRKGGRR